MLQKKDDLSWYASRAGSLRKEIGLPEAPEEGPKNNPLLDQLRSEGIKGSAEDHVFFTRRLPKGCLGCLKGEGTNLYITGLCTRDCFFCFNTKPRKDEMVLHGIKIRDPKKSGEIITRYGVRSVGISGGEPLLFPERVLAFIKGIKKLPPAPWIDLYTNGDLAVNAVLRRLKKAGLDGLRFNLVAREFDTGPIERALRFFSEVAVEIPVIPGKMRDLKEMVLRLDHLGVPALILHELFACRENEKGLADEGYCIRKKEKDSPLFWRPVAGGEEAALELLHFALHNTKKLSAYYCSCRTQTLISERGLRRRQKLQKG